MDYYDYKFTEALAKGAVKGVLEKSSEVITKKGKRALDKIEVNLGIAFTSYLNKSYRKYSTIKALLYKDGPHKLRDFLWYLNCEKETKKRVISYRLKIQGVYAIFPRETLL